MQIFPMTLNHLEAI